MTLLLIEVLVAFSTGVIKEEDEVYPGFGSVALTLTVVLVGSTGINDVDEDCPGLGRLA